MTKQEQLLKNAPRVYLDNVNFPLLREYLSKTLTISPSLWFSVYSDRIETTVPTKNGEVIKKWVLPATYQERDEETGEMAEYTNFTMRDSHDGQIKCAIYEGSKFIKTIKDFDIGDMLELVLVDTKTEVHKLIASTVGGKRRQISQACAKASKVYIEPDPNLVNKFMDVADATFQFNVSKEEIESIIQDSKIDTNSTSDIKTIRMFAEGGTVSISTPSVPIADVCECDKTVLFDVELNPKLFQMVCKEDQTFFLKPKTGDPTKLMFVIMSRKTNTSTTVLLYKRLNSDANIEDYNKISTSLED